MNITKRLRDLDVSRRLLCAGWRAITAAVAIGLWASVLGGCGAISPKVLTTPGNPVPVAEVFPSALLAEPIQLRAGHVYTTQPFQISGHSERWAVSLGFARSDRAVPLDEKLNGASNTCWIDTVRPPRFCRVESPGFNVQWELIKGDGLVAARHALDSSQQESGGTYSGAAITRTLSGFRDQPPGQYRLRVTVLRDARELDFLKPHILVNRPFFSSRLIE